MSLGLPFAFLQNTVCMATKSNASLISEQCWSTVCAAWHARRQCEKQRPKPPHDFMSPGTPRISKTGTRRRGRFLVLKMRGKLLQRTIRVTFLLSNPEPFLVPMVGALFQQMRPLPPPSRMCPQKPFCKVPLVCLSMCQ